MKRLFCLIGLSSCLAIPSVHAITQNFNFGGLGLALPDGDPSGLANLQDITSSITSIQDISVSLDISGTWNGDLYATIQHDSGFAILLNRVGRTAGNAFGFGDDGMQVTFNDSGGFSDVHTQTSGGGLLAGTFGSDGRAVDPDQVADTDIRTAGLDNLFGLDANGAWTLFVADLSGGDQHILNSWSLEITGTAGGVPVPDAGSTALMLTFVLVGLIHLRHTHRTSGAA